LPVFWVLKPAYLLTCIAVSCFTFFVAHVVQSRLKFVLWCDAIGLALFSVTGAEMSLAHNPSPVIAIAMGVSTATLGGVIRDILGGEVPVILRREIYVTAALLGAAIFVGTQAMGLPKDQSLIAGFTAAFLLRAAAIGFDLSLPVFKRGT
jgi:uncharacterized membrane protein YeiH